MKTIEERAKDYYEGDLELLQTRGWLDRSDIADIVEKAYIQGATEQKAIDERLIMQAKEDGELLAYNCEKRVRKEMIDKACEWLKINYGHFDGSIEDLVADFRKAMED